MEAETTKTLKEQIAERYSGFDQEQFEDPFSDEAGHESLKHHAVKRAEADYEERIYLGDLVAKAGSDEAAEFFVTIDECLDELVRVYRAANKASKDAAAQWKLIATDSKKTLDDLLSKNGIARFNGEHGQAYFTRPGETTRYDAKALDALCESDPKLADILRPHRKVSKRSGTLTIR